MKLPVGATFLTPARIDEIQAAAFSGGNLSEPSFVSLKKGGERARGEKQKESERKSKRERGSGPQELARRATLKAPGFGNILSHAKCATMDLFGSYDLGVGPLSAYLHLARAEPSATHRALTHAYPPRARVYIHIVIYLRLFRRRAERN